MADEAPILLNEAFMPETSGEDSIILEEELAGMGLTEAMIEPRLQPVVGPFQTVEQTTIAEAVGLPEAPQPPTELEGLGRVIADFASSISPIPPAVTEAGERVEFQSTPEDQKAAVEALKSGARMGIEAGTAFLGAGAGPLVARAVASRLPAAGALVAGSPFSQGLMAASGAAFGDLFGRRVNRDVGLSDQAGGFFDPLQKFDFANAQEAVDTLTENPVFIEFGGPVVARFLQRAGRGANIEGRRMLRESVGIGRGEAKKAMEKSFRVKQKELGFKRLEDQLDQSLNTAIADGMLINTSRNADEILLENQGAIRKLSQQIENQISEVDEIAPARFKAKWDSVNDYVNSRPAGPIRDRAKRWGKTLTEALENDTDGTLRALHDQKKSVYDLISNTAFLKDANTSQMLIHQIYRSIARDLKTSIELGVDGTKALSAGEKGSIKALNNVLSARLSLRPGLMTNKVVQDGGASLVATAERSPFEAVSRTVGSLITPDTDIRPGLAGALQIGGEAAERAARVIGAGLPAAPAVGRELPVILGIPLASYNPETGEVADSEERKLLVESLGRGSGLPAHQRVKLKSGLNRDGRILDPELVDLPAPTDESLAEEPTTGGPALEKDSSGKVKKKY